MADQVDHWSVAEWLRSFGFERYLNIFVVNGYETKKLCSNLKAEDLDEMRITEPPHRSILFNQSDMLRNGTGDIVNGKLNDDGYMSVPPLPAAASPESPTVSSVTSSDFNSETYSTVFDDISTESKAKSIPVHSSKPTIPKKPHVLSTSDSSKPLSKTLPTTRSSPGRSFKLNSSSLSSPPKTKLELKIVIRDLVQRDAIRLDQPPYCNEDGLPNVPALAKLGEDYSHELNIESLTVIDAIEDVWRYKMNETSDFVIPETVKLSSMSSSNPGSAASNNSFVFQNDSMYSEPFDSKLGKSKNTHNSTSSVPHFTAHSKEKVHVSPTKSSSLSSFSQSTNESGYLNPFDAIDSGPPVIVKTSPVNDKKKPAVSPKPTTLKNISEFSKESVKSQNPDSPNLSIHSSSSEDTIEKSPKIKKTWVPFRKSEKSPNTQKRKLKKRLSGSMEMLDEKSVSATRISRQSMPPQPNGTGLPRSISTNPALLYRESLQSNLAEDLRQSKKKFGGSHDTISQYSPKITSPIVNEFHKAGSPPSPNVRSRVKALNLGSATSELELSSVIEVYVGQQSNPVYFRKSQTFNGKEHTSPIQEKKSKGGGIISRFFKKKDKTKPNQSIEEEDGNGGDRHGDESGSEEDESGLTSSHSLPNIATIAQANIHSEYTELYDILEPKTKPQATPPKLPSRNPIQSHDTLSPQSSPPMHHKLMIKSDSASSNEIIHSLPSSGDDVIEIRNPADTSSNADTLYSKPWAHIPINRSPQSPNSKLTSSRRSSTSSSSGSPRKGPSTTMASPMRRRKLFDDGTIGVGSSQTLPHRGGRTGGVVTRSPNTIRRESMSKMTLDESLFRARQNTLDSVAENSKRRGRCLSTEDIFLDTPVDKDEPHMTNAHRDHALSLSDPRPHGLYGKAKLQRIQSSPGLGTNRQRRNILDQLKQTGISFDGQGIGLTPPITSEHDVATVTKSITQGHSYCEMAPLTNSEGTRRSSDGVVELQMKKLRSQSKHRSSNKNRNRSILELRVESLLDLEGIDLTVTPYTNTKGEYGIPTALLSRYAQDVSSTEEELVKAFDAIRRAELLKQRRAHIPLKKDWRKFSDVHSNTLEDFLVSIGLPQYYDPLMDLGIISTEDLQRAAMNVDLSSLPLKEPHKIHLRAFVKRL